MFFEEEIDLDEMLDKKLENLIAADQFKSLTKYAVESEPPTKRQIAGLKLIECELQIKYKGLMYKNEVSKFLNKYLDTAKDSFFAFGSGPDFD